MRSAQLDGNKATCTSFMEAVEESVKSAWPECVSGEEKWAAIKTAFTEAGRSVLGTCVKHTPDWFREQAGTITPALVHRNQQYTKWLATHRQTDLRKLGARL